MKKLLITSTLCAFFMSSAYALGTLDEEIERNKKALEEFKTLSDYEKCIYLKLSFCNDLK